MRIGPRGPSAHATYSYERAPGIFGGALRWGPFSPASSLWWKPPPPLEAHQVGELGHHPPVRKVPELPLHAPPFGQDEEEITSGPMDEVETEVRGDVLIEGVVLNQGVG